MAHPMEQLTSFNYHQWKEEIESLLHTKNLHRLTMELEADPILNYDKEKYWNRLYEAFGCMCLSISRYLLLHIKGLKTPKDIWDNLSSLLDKENELGVHHLENELISFHPSSFETLNEFFTKFKNLIFQLKLCKVEKEDDQLILSILSKIGANYSIFVQLFNR